MGKRDGVVLANWKGGDGGRANEGAEAVRTATCGGAQYTCLGACAREAVDGGRGCGACAVGEAGRSACAEERRAALREMPLFFERPPVAAETLSRCNGTGLCRLPRRGAAGGTGRAHQADTGNGAVAGGRAEAHTTTPRPSTPSSLLSSFVLGRWGVPTASTTWSTCRKNTSGCRRRTRVRR